MRTILLIGLAAGAAIGTMVQREVTRREVDRAKVRMYEKYQQAELLKSAVEQGLEAGRAEARYAALRQEGQIPL